MPPATFRSSQGSALTAAIGLAPRTTARRPAVEAAEIVRARLGGGTAHLALVVTAGVSGAEAARDVREVLGPIGVAGGATSGILTDSGVITDGVLVIGMSTEGDAATGAASMAADDVADAARGAARLVMSGWPFRLRYPRGLGVAFASSGSPVAMLEGWRQFMGPKMRTVCGVTSGPVHGSREGIVSVACLEAAYATGLGFAEGFAPDVEPDHAVLIQGAAEATTTALKRLDERSARLVLVLESVTRHRVLGADAHDEWARIRGEAGDRVPCVGWLCERVAGYGRGIKPVDQDGSLIVAAVGDPVSAESE